MLLPSLLLPIHCLRLYCERSSPSLLFPSLTPVSPSFAAASAQAVSVSVGGSTAASPQQSLASHSFPAPQARDLRSPDEACKGGESLLSPSSPPSDVCRERDARSALLPSSLALYLLRWRWLPPASRDGTSPSLSLVSRPEHRWLQRRHRSARSARIRRSIASSLVGSDDKQFQDAILALSPPSSLSLASHKFLRLKHQEEFESLVHRSSFAKRRQIPSPDPLSPSLLRENEECV